MAAPSDNLQYNPFYQLLKEQHWRKFLQAKDSHWKICVPCHQSLRGIPITQEFVDAHLLKPSGTSEHQYTSTDEDETLTVYQEGSCLKVQEDFSEQQNYHKVSILWEEEVYNKQLEPFSIWVLDRPISSKFKALVTFDEVWDPLKKITSLPIAEEFLSRFPSHKPLLAKLQDEVTATVQTSTFDPARLSEARDTLQSLVRTQWAMFLKVHPLEERRDTRFQNLLTAAIETYIAERLHEKLFGAISAKHRDLDLEILEKTQELNQSELEPEQLNLPKSLWVPLPAAVVELASLDSLLSPAGKLNCIHGALELVEAEVKAAMADARSLGSGDGEDDGDEERLPLVGTEQMQALLVLLLIRTQPPHLASSLYYAHMMQWAASTQQQISLQMLRRATEKLLSLPPRRPRENETKRDEEVEGPCELGLKKELSLEEVMQLTGHVERRFGRSRSHHEEEGPPTPSDCRMRRLASLLEASASEVDLFDTSLHYSSSSDSNSRSLQRRSMPNMRELLACFNRNDICE